MPRLARFSQRLVFRWTMPIFVAAVVSGFSQERPHPVVSPEVSSDRHVTFRFRDPNAKQVRLSLEGVKDPEAMEKDGQGVWSLTVGPLAPDLYGYAFEADGVSMIDPSNSLMKPNLLHPQSVVHVPGPPSLPWEINDVPHGVVHHHFYRSQIIGDNRDFFVYTPPGYDPKGSVRYPVLYLLHGYSDDASGWTAVGRANTILDNLIAQGKAKPMLVVMPLGYGALEILSPSGPAFSDASLRDRNFDRFRQALIQEVIPVTASTYLVTNDREQRAIAGLSMGGAESLLTGLNLVDRFAWIGSFSAGGLGENLDQQFPALDSKVNAQLHLLWIACGTDDFLVGPNRKFRDWLTSKGIQHTDIDTSGAHAWMVWRRNLATFVPLLFQSK